MNIEKRTPTTGKQKRIVTYPHRVVPRDIHSSPLGAGGGQAIFSAKYHTYVVPLRTGETLGKPAPSLLSPLFLTWPSLSQQMCHYFCEPTQAHESRKVRTKVSKDSCTSSHLVLTQRAAGKRQRPCKRKVAATFVLYCYCRSIDQILRSMSSRLATGAHEGPPLTKNKNCFDKINCLTRVHQRSFCLPQATKGFTSSGAKTQPTIEPTSRCS